MFDSETSNARSRNDEKQNDELGKDVQDGTQKKSEQTHVWESKTGRDVSGDATSLLLPRTEITGCSGKRDVAETTVKFSG